MQKLEFFLRRLATGLATTSNYFFVRGQIRLARADIRMEALVRRSG